MQSVGVYERQFLHSGEVPSCPILKVLHRSGGTEPDILIFLWLHHRLISKVPPAQYGNTKLGHYHLF
jgi:hypothetical protein